MGTVPLGDPTSGGHACILVGHSRALSLPETLVGVGGITLPDRQTFSSLRQDSLPSPPLVLHSVRLLGDLWWPGCPAWPGFLFTSRS